jgi:hypothetical protein
MACTLEIQTAVHIDRTLKLVNERLSEEGLDSVFWSTDDISSIAYAKSQLPHVEITSSQTFVANKSPM